MKSVNDVWDAPTLSQISEFEKGRFYDHLAKNIEGSYAFTFKEPKVWEATDWKLGVILNDGVIISPYNLTAIDIDNYELTTIKEGVCIDIHLDKVFYYQMPCKQFLVQIMLKSTHAFDNHPCCEIGYCITANGQDNSSLEFLGDICISSLKVEKILKLNLAVNILADRNAEKIVSALNSAPLKEGIKLTSLYDPVFSTVFHYMNAATIAILNCKNNKAISRVPFTLAGSPGFTGAPMLQASYVLLQNWKYKNEVFSWNNFKWNFDANELLEKESNCTANYYIVRLMERS
ncbi:MAG: hypothetical protein ACQEW0_02295 [Pseudomonadota bacterium]